MSMLKTVVESQPERPVTFIHAAQNGNLHAMREVVEELAHKHPQLSYYWCYEKPTEQDRDKKAFHKEGYVDLPWLQQVIMQKEASYYFCGPVPFMKAMNHALKEWGIPAEDIHYEFFGPAGSLD